MLDETAEGFALSEQVVIDTEALCAVVDLLEPVHQRLTLEEDGAHETAQPAARRCADATQPSDHPGASKNESAETDGQATAESDVNSQHRGSC